MELEFLVFFLLVFHHTNLPCAFHPQNHSLWWWSGSHKKKRTYSIPKVRNYSKGHKSEEKKIDGNKRVKKK